MTYPAPRTPAWEAEQGCFPAENPQDSRRSPVPAFEKVFDFRAPSKSTPWQGLASKGIDARARNGGGVVRPIESQGQFLAS